MNVDDEWLVQGVHWTIWSLATPIKGPGQGSRGEYGMWGNGVMGPIMVAIAIWTKHDQRDIGGCHGQYYTCDVDGGGEGRGERRIY